MTAPHARWSSGDPQAVLDGFEQLPGFVWIFEGPELRVVAANPAVRAAVGNRSGLIGEPFRRAVPELAGQHIFELLDQALHGIRSHGYEQRVLTDRNGDGTLTEAFYTFDMAPWRNPDGSVRGVIVQAVDATPVVAARQAAETAAATASGATVRPPVWSWNCNAASCPTCCPSCRTCRSPPTTWSRAATSSLAGTGSTWFPCPTGGSR